ncbi:hypothetical protein F5Y10DRAFT_284440 [Nemania abortiva]|nr:hypothetical protein F5Y10DRAFT_284440 [Nemania abortiva]
MTAPAGFIPRDLLQKTKAQIEPENSSRGLVTKSKLAKVLKMERVMYELQVPQHLWADIIGSLAASDMTESGCHVATLRGYLSDAGQATNDRWTKVDLIEAIVKYWVQAGDLSSVKPINKKGVFPRPSSKSQGETASATELATPVAKNGATEGLLIPSPPAVADILSPPAVADILSPPAVADILSPPAVADNPPTAEGMHLGSPSLLRNQRSVGVGGPVAPASGSAPAGPEERETPDAHHAKYAPDQDPRVPAGSHLSPLSSGRSHSSADDPEAWDSGLTMEELQEQLQFYRAQTALRKGGAQAGAVLSATQNNNNPGIAYLGLAPEQDKGIGASSTGSTQRPGQSNPASFYHRMDQAINSTRVGSTPYDSVRAFPELQKLRKDGAELAPLPQRPHREPPKRSLAERIAGTIFSFKANPPQARTDPFYRAQSPPYPQTWTNPRPQVQTDLYPQVQTDLYPQVQTDLYPQVQTDLYPQVQTDPYPQVQTGPYPQVQADPYPQVQTDAPVASPPPWVQTNPRPQVQTDPYPQAQTDAPVAGPRPHVQASPRPQVQTDPRPQAQSGPRPQVQSDPHPQVQTDPRPQVQSDPHPQVQTDPRPQVWDTTSRPHTNALPSSQADARPPYYINTPPNISAPLQSSVSPRIGISPPAQDPYIAGAPSHTNIAPRIKVPTYQPLGSTPPMRQGTHSGEEPPEQESIMQSINDAFDALETTAPRQLYIDSYPVSISSIVELSDYLGRLEQARETLAKEYYSACGRVDSGLRTFAIQKLKKERTFPPVEQWIAARNCYQQARVKLDRYISQCLQHFASLLQQLTSS